MVFEDDVCKLPFLLYDGNINRIDEKGRWKVFQQNERFVIGFDTSNEIFSGNHKLRFGKDEQAELLKLYIESSDLYIKCTKGLFNYQRNLEAINELIQITK